MAISSSKRNEHPRCGCFHCRHNAGSKSAQQLHRKVNRNIRHRYNEVLRNTDLTETPTVVISTPPTD